MLKYCTTLVLIVMVILVIGFVRNKYATNLKNPLHTELQLAANFGEIRTGHFHMGLDIRTDGKEGLPVYAIEDGYISKVKMDPGGYGKAITITHTNGLTSLYAHLDALTGEMEKYLLRRQYETKSWQQDMELPADRFVVKKGELVAYSGDTGHSEGPHLHFELRDTKTGKSLNPALYGYQVEDHTPPSMVGLYWYDRRYSTYESGATAIAISGQNGKYVVGKKVVKVTSPLISFGIRADDRVDGSRFRYGIHRAQVWMDDVLIHDVSMNNIPASDTRYVNAHIDYSARIRHGYNIQHLSKLPGNLLPVFGDKDGLIRLPDNALHEIHIRVTDVAGNESDLRFMLQRGSVDPVVHRSCYQWLAPRKHNTLNGEHAIVHFGKKSFYDSVPFVYRETVNGVGGAVSPLVSLHNPTVPVHEPFTVLVATNLPPGSPLRNKTVMQFTGFKKKLFVKGVWEGNYMVEEFDELGTVQLMVDEVAPLVGELEQDEKGISIDAVDQLSGIASFIAELDGGWVLITQKGNRYTYTFDEHCSPGRHRLKLRIMDVAGNITEKTFSFTR